MYPPPPPKLDFLFSLEEGHILYGIDQYTGFIFGRHSRIFLTKREKVNTAPVRNPTGQEQSVGTCRDAL